MANIAGHVCPKCKSDQLTLLRPSQFLSCDHCSNVFTKLESMLVTDHPNLCAFVSLLVQKVKSPISSLEEKKETELVLKDIRLLVEKSRKAGKG